jgi:hypothetical protein
MFPDAHLVRGVLLADRNWYPVHDQSFQLQQTRQWGKDGQYSGMGYSFATVSDAGDELHLFGPTHQIIAIAIHRAPPRPRQSNGHQGQEAASEAVHVQVASTDVAVPR